MIRSGGIGVKHERQRLANPHDHEAQTRFLMVRVTKTHLLLHLPGDDPEFAPSRLRTLCQLFNPLPSVLIQDCAVTPVWCLNCLNCVRILKSRRAKFFRQLQAADESYVTHLVVADELEELNRRRDARLIRVMAALLNECEVQEPVKKLL